MARLLFWLALAIFALIAPRASAQNVSRAYCDKDGKAHIVYRGGAERTLPVEPGQVGCDHISIAADGRTVGWSVLVENDGTSYPIAISVLLYRDKSQTVISPAQAVWEWQFIDGGKRVAVLSGPLHGGASEAKLYDSHSGKVLATWAGKSTTPNWAEGWQEKFGER
jgi:hypothetical protein